jgi:DNA-binding SARP family transcriptional activator
MAISDDNDKMNNEGCRIAIRTLGNFSVRRGNRILSAESDKSQKMWELFKYIITNRGKNILAETIQDTLWPDQDYEYSSKAFRTMIHRLRQVLKKGLPEESNIQTIVFSHGCYSWNPNLDYTLDAEEFEQNYVAARKVKASDSLKTLECYRNMLELYQGSYLSESMYTEWTIPFRNHYRRVYLESMADYCNLLVEQGDTDTILEVCENVTLLEPLEEDFHLFLMEALIKKGKIKDARQNYEYITTKLYHELGLRPSAEMRSLYGKITAKDKANRADIDSVQEGIINQPSSDGPFYCDKKTFQSIYDLERRRAERSGQSVFIVLLTLQLSPRVVGEQDTIKKALTTLKDIIERSLRKGDVCSLWGDLQFILILPSINMEQTKLVVERLEKAFREIIKQDEILLKARYQPILANLIIK